MSRSILASALILALTSGVAFAQAPAPAATPADEAVTPAEAVEDLNAAVRPPPANSDADALSDIRAHEDRAAEALDPNNPSAVADFQPRGPGCGAQGALLACGTNLEARPRPGSTADGAQTPDSDLLGRPR